VPTVRGCGAERSSFRQALRYFEAGGSAILKSSVAASAFPEPKSRMPRRGVLRRVQRVSFDALDQLAKVTPMADSTHPVQSESAYSDVLCQAIVGAAETFSTRASVQLLR
jgi:hypothetical protein